MTLAGFLGLLVASVVIIAVPGPSVMYLLGQALALGRRPALGAVIGNSTGMAVVAVLVAFGLSALFARYGWVQPTLRLAGAIVLAGIGWSYLRSRSGHEFDDVVAHGSGHGAGGGWSAAAGGSEGARPRSALATSVLVGVSNPKALVMFGVVVPSFVAAGTTPSSLTLLAMSAVPLCTGMVLDSAWVLVASAARSWFLRAPSRIVAINRVGGILMLGMAAVMVHEVAHEAGLSEFR